MEEKKKRKGGNEYYREKITNLGSQNKELKNVIEIQSKKISDLTAMLHNEQSAHEADVKRLSVIADDLMHYMGWLRRWIWVTFRAEKFVD